MRTANVIHAFSDVESPRPRAREAVVGPAPRTRRRSKLVLPRAAGARRLPAAVAPARDLSLN